MHAPTVGTDSIRLEPRISASTRLNGISRRPPPFNKQPNSIRLRADSIRPYAQDNEKPMTSNRVMGFLHILLVLFQLLDFGQRGLGLPHGKQRAAPNGDASLFPDEVIAHP